MLRSVSIRNYQSIDKADLELAPFTVLVGASNSGKSASLRAMKMLANNTSSQGFVKVGSPSATVEALIADDEKHPGMKVGLERGPSLSTYFLIGAEEARYPKSGVSVPDDVKQVLRLGEVEGESLNFAFQFDRPFLLATPGTTVSKIFGDLTKINVLYDAVREANRRKLETASRLKVRRSDEADLSKQMEGFRWLKDEKVAVEGLASRLKDCHSLDVRVNNLGILVNSMELVESRLDSLRASVSPLPEVRMGDLESGVAAATALRGALKDAVESESLLARARVELVQDEVLVQEAQQRFQEALHESGECPLCGAAT